MDLDAVADDEERANLRLRDEGKRCQKHDMQDVLEPQAKTKLRLEPKSAQKRESTELLPDFEEEFDNTMLAVPVVCGATPT